jgi:hypothetical protein
VRQLLAKHIATAAVDCASLTNNRVSPHALGTKPGRYRPSDALLSFLDTL